MTSKARRQTSLDSNRCSAEIGSLKADTNPVVGYSDTLKKLSGFLVISLCLSQIASAVSLSDIAYYSLRAESKSFSKSVDLDSSSGKPSNYIIELVGKDKFHQVEFSQNEISKLAALKVFSEPEIDFYRLFKVVGETRVLMDKSALDYAFKSKDILPAITVIKAPTIFKELLSFADAIEAVNGDFGEALDPENAIFSRTINAYGSTVSLSFDKKIHRKPLEILKEKPSKDIFKSTTSYFESAQNIEIRDCALKHKKQDSDLFYKQKFEGRYKVAIMSRSQIDSSSWTVRYFDAGCKQTKLVNLYGLELAPTRFSLDVEADGLSLIYLSFAKIHSFRTRVVPSDEIRIFSENGTLDAHYKIETKYYSPRLNVVFDSRKELYSGRILKKRNQPADSKGADAQDISSVVLRSIQSFQ